MPSIQYMAKLYQYPKICIEQHEHFTKGTYRNRSYILTATGKKRLSIPLMKGKNEQQTIREVQIANYQNWQQIHWRSLQTAYGKSPFFEYYSDDIRPLYEQKYSSLFDFNWNVLLVLCDLLGFQVVLEKSSEYTKLISSDSVVDFRDAIHPKTHKQKGDTSFNPIAYEHVFFAENGFVPNLSILDLLFCTGPEAMSIVASSCVK